MEYIHWNLKVIYSVFKLLELFLCLLRIGTFSWNNRRWMIMLIRKLDDVSILCENSGSTVIGIGGKWAASPHCIFDGFLLNDIHVVPIVNNNWLSFSTLRRSRDVFQEIWKYFCHYNLIYFRFYSIGSGGGRWLWFPKNLMMYPFSFRVVSLALQPLWKERHLQPVVLDTLLLMINM